MNEREQFYRDSMDDYENGMAMMPEDIEAMVIAKVNALDALEAYCNTHHCYEWSDEAYFADERLVELESEYKMACSALEDYITGAES